MKEIKYVKSIMKVNGEVKGYSYNVDDKMVYSNVDIPSVYSYPDKDTTVVIFEDGTKITRSFKNNIFTSKDNRGNSTIEKYDDKKRLLERNIKSNVGSYSIKYKYTADGLKISDNDYFTEVYKNEYIDDEGNKVVTTKNKGNNINVTKYLKDTEFILIQTYNGKPSFKVEYDKEKFNNDKVYRNLKEIEYNLKGEKMRTTEFEYSDVTKKEVDKILSTFKVSRKLKLKSKIKSLFLFKVRFINCIDMYKFKLKLSLLESYIGWKNFFMNL